MPSERRDIAALIGAVRRRLVFRTGALALAAGAAGAARLRIVEILGGWPGTPVLRFGLAGVIAAAMLRVLHRRTTRAAAARAIEQACQACRNLAITAEQCGREPARWPASVRGRVLEAASRTTAGLHPRAVVPLRGTLAALVMFAGLTAAAAPAVERPLLQLLSASVVAPASAAAATVVHVTVRTRRLIPLAVTPDDAPSVRIEAPGRDLLLPDGERSIPLEIAASDDLGLGSVEVRYTHVSGSGEQYEFVEGTVPVEPIIESPRQWQGRTLLRLTPLDLRPGDSIVYRAVARDRRAGDTGLATSDTYIVEIAGPGQIALDGVDMPPGPERYALSQQMIVLKLARLRLRQAGLTPEALRDETVSLAAELAAVDPAAALPPARAAVEALRRAFARSRYLLRALSTRSQLDLSRRLTGASADASGWRRTTAETDHDVAAARRRMLADLLQAAHETAASDVVDRRRAQDLAEAALRIDAVSPVWRQAAGDLLAVRNPNDLRLIIGLVAAEVQKDGLPRTPLTDRRSAVSRVFRERER